MKFADRYPYPYVGDKCGPTMYTGIDSLCHVDAEFTQFQSLVHRVPVCSEECERRMTDDTETASYAEAQALDLADAEPDTTDYSMPAIWAGI